MSRQSRQNVVYEKNDNSVVWKLLQYVSPSGRRTIDDWRASLSIPRQADCDVFLRNLVKMARWQRPDISGLSGKHLAGFYELRWRSQNVPHRIGGYFSVNGVFVMLIGWTHNAKKYDPPTALELLISREKQLRREEATIDEFTVPTGSATSK